MATAVKERERKYIQPRFIFPCNFSNKNHNLCGAESALKTSQESSSCVVDSASNTFVAGGGACGSSNNGSGGRAGRHASLGSSGLLAARLLGRSRLLAGRSGGPGSRSSGGSDLKILEKIL